MTDKPDPIQQALDDWLTEDRRINEQYGAEEKGVSDELATRAKPLGNAYGSLTWDEARERNRELIRWRDEQLTAAEQRRQKAREENDARLDEKLRGLRGGR